MLSEKEKKVLQLIDENRGEVVGCLSKLISFKTVSPPLGGKAEDDEYIKLQDFVCKFLEGMNFDIDSWEIDASKLKSFPGSGVRPDKDLSNMPVVVGKLKGGGQGKSLLLNGHIDVVPATQIGSWAHDPFKGEVADNKIFGRGACDMKGGVAAMLEAVKFIHAAGIKLNGDLTVETVPEEESSEMGTLACCQKGYTADAAIIPEPTNMDVLVAMRGGTGGEITVYGRAGHAEMTQPHWREGGAVNAISKAVKILQGLEELKEDWRTRPDKKHKFLDPDTITPTMIKGGEWSVTYPEKVEITYDAMFIPKTEKLWEEIEEKIKSVAATDSWMKEHPPTLKTGWVYGTEISEDEPIVKAGIEAVKELGIEPKLVGWGTLSDAIHLVNYSRIPTISIGLNNSRIHGNNEYADIDELMTLTKVLALAIMRWCGCE